MKHQFKIGDRVRLNQQARSRFTRIRSHFGVVVRLVSHSEALYVLFDGKVTPLLIHYRYIDKRLK
jgi:hypothetical protein